MLHVFHSISDNETRQGENRIYCDIQCNDICDKNGKGRRIFYYVRTLWPSK